MSPQQQDTQRRFVGLAATQEPSALIGHQIARPDDDQPESVDGDLPLAGRRICALDSTMHSADRQHAGLVEVGNGLVVLTLSILDHESMACVVGIHRKGAPRAIAARVADQPIEAVLTACRLLEDRVAQINRVSLIRVRATAGALRCSNGSEPFVTYISPERVSLYSGSWSVPRCSTSPSCKQGSSTRSIADMLSPRSSATSSTRLHSWLLLSQRTLRALRASICLCP